MIKNIKAIGPVVAVSLLIVVTVLAVLGFQIWFQNYSSSTLTGIESKSSPDSFNSGIEKLIGQNLYFNNAGTNNLTISKVEIDGIDCNISGNYSIGITSLNVSSCLNNITTSTPEIVVVTDKGIYQESAYVKEFSSSNSLAISPPNYNSFTPCTSNPIFYNGSGTLGSPYGICDCTQLQSIGTNLEGNYTLLGDIDCNDTINWNAGKGFNPIGNSSNTFFGSFNGNKYIIFNLFINRTFQDNIGLFGYFRGYINNSYIKNSLIIGNNNIGALGGKNYYGNIYNSYSLGNIYGSSYVGGLIGYNNGNIDNSYSSSSVSGNSQVGGLVGYNYAGTINNSYSSGNVSGSSLVGGLVGGDDYGTIDNSYWDTQTSGQATSAAGTGKTTAQMMQQATFVGWDFTNIWNINETTSYPFLR